MLELSIRQGQDEEKPKMNITRVGVDLAIAENPDTAGLHGKDRLAALSEVTGKPVSGPLVGRRLQRLVEQNLVSKTKRSTYQVELPGFKEWAVWTQSSK